MLVCGVSPSAGECATGSVASVDVPELAVGTLAHIPTSSLSEISGSGASSQSAEVDESMTGLNSGLYRADCVLAKGGFGASLSATSSLLEVMELLELLRLIEK